MAFLAEHQEEIPANVALISQVKPSGSRFDNIDLLRALAIIPVLLFHYTTRFPLDFYQAASVPFRLPWGKYGVDLFFAVSGYCIFLTLDSSSSLSNFWAKRFARIHPAFVVSVVLTFVAVGAFGLPGREVSAMTALANAFWLILIPTVRQVDGVYWSLIVELKFYFFVGIIYWLCGGRRLSLWWALFAVVGAIVFRLVQPVGEWIFIAPYAPSFLVGLLAYEAGRLSKPMLWTLCAVALGLTATSGRFDQPWIGLAIMALAFAVLQLRRLKVPRPITYIGLISYSLYLIHDNIGLIAIRALSPLPMGVRIVIVALFVGAIAALMNRLVEIRWQKALTRRVQAVMDGAWGKLPRPKLRLEAGELRRW